MNRPLPPGWSKIVPDDVATRSPHALAIGPFGSNLKVSDYKSSGVPLVFVRHIRAERFDADTHFVSQRKAEELSAHSVTGGDVLITKMGEPPGDSALYPRRRPDAIITADCIKWSIDPRLGEPKFFMYAIRTSELRQQIIAITQGVAQKKVSLGRFRTITLPYAPRDEQARVVDAIDSYLTRLDQAVASLERVRAKLKAYRASVLKAAIEGRLVPTEVFLARAEKRDRRAVSPHPPGTVWPLGRSGTR
jgi:type I restriction enzyme S subunit